MKKKRQNLILNVLMTAAIALIVFSGIMIAGNIQRTETSAPPAPTLNISDMSGTENQTHGIPEDDGVSIGDAMTVKIVGDGSETVEVSTSDSGAVSGSSCTISIVCDTILNNLDKLRDGKEAFVPANGVILAASSISISDGDTVFDVLKKACELADIQLEYSYTPLRGSYYIEGINNLYEFDCGEQSGWMYKVNGVFPDHGCSAYYLSAGDEIVFCYTCVGLGADVGGSMD